MELNDGRPGPSDMELSAQESRSYWDRRHAEQSALRAGGNIGLDEASNAMLYAVRGARLVEAMGSTTSAALPRRVLDAGCGNGHFSRLMASFGHRVDGIDTSPTALGICRSSAGPRESYHHSALSEWAPPYLYDVVVSIDVLYHIMNDEEWEASVRNLAGLIRLGGMIGLVDHDTEKVTVHANYQKTRPASAYRRLLEECGLELRKVVPNAFRTDPSVMHVAVRVA